ncbi:hypothetical protein WS99_16125 [Burkholderia territorii]|nr:hypothetical protein WS99_16125 [Burkholderia territorii]
MHHGSRPATVRCIVLACMLFVMCDERIVPHRGTIGASGLVGLIDASQTMRSWPDGVRNPLGMDVS